MHPFQALAVPEGKVGIHWFGQNSYALKHPSGAIVQVDPYFPRERPPDRFVYAEPPLNEAELKTDFVLLTHDHGDHTCIESLLRTHAAFPECRYIGPPESMANLQENGIAANLTTAVTAGDSATLGPMTAHALWSKPPEGDPEAEIAPPNVQHLGFVVEVGRVRCYITGDAINTFAEHDDLIQAVAAHQPHIGFLTTHPTEGEFPFFAGSVEAALKLGLKAAVPSHYRCFVKRDYDPEPWADMFPADGPTPILIPYNSAIVYPD